MNKKSKEIIPDKKYELDLQMDVELGRAIRQQRVLERDVEFYNSGGKIAKQRRVAEILQNETNDLLNDLFVATSSTRKKEDEHVTTSIISLLGQHNSFDSEIKIKQRGIKEINDAITQTRKKVAAIKSKVMSENQEQERNLYGQKTLEGLENRLDTATKQYCTIVTENRALREEIEHILTERINFNKTWYGFITNLNKGKKFMMDVIEQATIAYDRRDELVYRLNALRGRAYADLQIHTSEMLVLQKKLDYDHELEDFIGTKSQRRNMSSLEQNLLQEKQKKRGEMSNCLSKYKTIINNIKDFTGIDPKTEQDSFIQHFTKGEEQNMSMFTCINEIQIEIDDLNREIVQQRDDIDRQTKVNNERASKQTLTVASLRDELAVGKKEAATAKKLLDSTNQSLKSLYQGITKLFHICKCSKAPFVQLLYDNTRVNEYNVILYLQILEQRVSTLLVNVYFKEKSAKKGKPEQNIINEGIEPNPVYTIHQTVPTNPCPLCVDRELVCDVIDTLQFTQTRAEVREKLNQRLTLPDGLERLHNVSACNLPKSRQIIQRRYQ